MEKGLATGTGSDIPSRSHQVRKKGLEKKVMGVYRHLGSHKGNDRRGGKKKKRTSREMTLWGNCNSLHVRMLFGRKAVGREGFPNRKKESSGSGSEKSYRK